MIVDGHGRRFRNLRVSLTAACNYACNYCVPNGKRLVAAQDELTTDEIITAIRLLISAAGIEKIRITGGEPLVSPKFDSLLPAIMAMGLTDVSLTTNGQLVPRKIDVLRDSGVQRINVSLDTLTPERFRAIARSGDLPTVLEGLDLLQQAGIRLKLNMVPMRSQNADEILPMLDFCIDRGIELRYIELMNMGHLHSSGQYRADFIGMDEILDIIGRRYEFTRTDAPYDSTAVRFEIPGEGFFGIIANESEPFCSSCTRLRLSSNGFLYGCLSNTARHDLSDIVRMPEHDALDALYPVLGRALADKQALSFSGEVTVMKFIGG